MRLVTVVLCCVGQHDSPPGIYGGQVDNMDRAALIPCLSVTFDKEVSCVSFFFGLFIFGCRKVLCRGLYLVFGLPEVGLVTSYKQLNIRRNMVVALQYLY